MFIDKRKYCKFLLNAQKHKLFLDLIRKRRRWNKRSKIESLSKQIYFLLKELIPFKLYLKETQLSTMTWPKPRLKI